MIPFNKPFSIGNEFLYMQQALESGKISGDGKFTHQCHKLLQQRYGFNKVLLTTSCTDALEMAALLLDIKPGDEVIVPAYTFVSTANAFALRGATIKFCDVTPDTFNIDPEKAAELINNRTRAIVPVHYAGVSCQIDQILALAAQHNLAVVEDAAQAIDSYYNNQPLGGIGTFGTFSFHETKNIISGEGGALVINDPEYNKRAEIIREKGTNRSEFFRGEANKYEWKDLGSSFLPSDLTAAYLLAQLNEINKIQQRRTEIWQTYYNELKALENQERLRLPIIPAYATNNANLFYLLCNSQKERDSLIAYLKDLGITAVFHYLPLHKSYYFNAHHDGRALPVTEMVSSSILRLPLFYTLTKAEQAKVITAVQEFFSN